MITPEVAAIKQALKDFPVTVQLKRPTGRKSYWKTTKIVIEKDTSDGVYAFGDDMAERFNSCFPGLYRMDGSYCRVALNRDEVKDLLKKDLLKKQKEAAT